MNIFGRREPCERQESCPRPAGTASLTPIICDVSRFELKMEWIVGEKLKDIINIELSEIEGKLWEDCTGEELFMGILPPPI